ncbi:MAG: hypothetical protein OXH56_02640 [Gemmatimonadetes bacterium]|nr:hypothetical protein [Gemmatimonadota bacterium]
MSRYMKLVLMTGLIALMGGFLQSGPGAERSVATDRLRSVDDAARITGSAASTENTERTIREITGLFGPFGPEEAYARRGFGGFRSSRSLWNRRSSFGRRSPFARRSTPAATLQTPARTTAGQPSATAARSTRAGAATAGRATARSSVMGRRVQSETARRSLATHQSRQAGFAQSSNSAANTSSYRDNGLYNRGSQNRTSYDNYYAGRDSYYGGMGWRTPGYAFMSYPSFGMWDALFMWSMLDMMSSRRHYAVAHHHANDPGYQEWRSEAERLAEDNTELRAKLDELDRQVATLEGTPRDPEYLPPGVTPAIALAAEVVATADPNQPRITVNTGVANGNYHRFGQILQSHLPDFDVMLETTAGSEENLNNLVRNQVDAILVQSDILNSYLRKNPDAEDQLVGLQSTLYTEYVQLIVNEDGGIASVSDLEPNTHIVYVGPRGSGTHRAWEGFVLQDPRYGEFNTRFASYEEALSQVAENANAVMLFVAGLNSELLKEADRQHGLQLSMVAVDEHYFSTAVDQFGNTIYEVATIPHETYPELQEGWLFGYFDSSVETLTVDAILILSKQWVDTYGSKPMTLFEDALWRSIDDIKPIVGEE